MQHPLDNPIWHALTGPQANLAIGSGQARQYPRDVTPFAAIAEPSASAYADLAALPAGEEARLVRPADEPTPAGWQTLSVRPLIQMVADDIVAKETNMLDKLHVLGANDAADMLQLAELAKPGPFGPRTFTLGRYVGYRRDGRLLAMAGERFRPPGFVEVSAISVHPDARRMGLGAALTMSVARHVLAQGLVPFLHVFPDNPAIALYHRLGFRERARLWVVWRRPIAST